MLQEKTVLGSSAPMRDIRLQKPQTSFIAQTLQKVRLASLLRSISQPKQATTAIMSLHAARLEKSGCRSAISVICEHSLIKFRWSR